LWPEIWSSSCHDVYFESVRPILITAFQPSFGQRHGWLEMPQRMPPTSFGLLATLSSDFCFNLLL